jgi:hypothetical protein
MSEQPVQILVGNLVATTMMLSAKEMGAYMLLLVAAHQNGGYLPTEDERLRQVARLPKDEFSATWGVLGRYFEEDGGFLWSIHLREWNIAARLVGRRPLSIAVREFVLRRDGHRCAYCGATTGPFHIDHVLSVARGGSDDPTNLTVACKPCNLSKGAKTVEEWLQ